MILLTGVTPINSIKKILWPTLCQEILQLKLNGQNMWKTQTTKIITQKIENLNVSTPTKIIQSIMKYLPTMK